MDENNKLYAFWEHGNMNFSTYLHAEVTKVHDDGMVSVKGYTSCKFVPVLLLPLEAGQKLGKEVDKTNKEIQDKIGDAIHSGTARLRSLLKRTAPSIK